MASPAASINRVPAYKNLAHLVSDVFSFVGRWRLEWISGKPLPLDELVVLLRPKHSSQSLPHNLFQIVGDCAHRQRMIKLVCLFPSVFDNLVEKPFVIERRVVGRWGYRGELQSDDGATAIRRNVLEYVVSTGLRTLLFWVHKGLTVREGCARPLLFLVGRIVVRPSP